MTEKSIGIIGGGIVGATAAYYLARSGQKVTLFDHGKGQASKAAAGIINPWFSLRRNQAWYQVVAKGAEFYRELINDLDQDGYPSQDIFQVDGALMIRHSDKRYRKDLDQAAAKRPESPSMGEVKTVQAQDYFPWAKTKLKATYVEGGGRVDGSRLIETLHRAIKDLGGQIIQAQASLQGGGNSPLLVQANQATYSFDHLLLAVGAWLPALLEPLGYQVDIRPQKGQLYVIEDPDFKDRHWPVIMPSGLADIIPFNNGQIIVGASHEDDQAYNLDPDMDQIEALRSDLAQIAPDLAGYPIKEVRVGTRAQSKDYSVVLGRVPGLNQVWAVSGLGSSGLTSGPYIGAQWAQYILSGQWDIQEELYPIDSYIHQA